MFECFIDSEYIRDVLPSCSCSQGGPVRRDWIFHGVIAHSLLVFNRLELEGKEVFYTVQFISNRQSWSCRYFIVCVVSFSLRVNFTTLGSIRSLRSPPQPFLCHPRSTTCCTSACLPSPLTLQPSSTTELDSSACTSLMIWWAAASWFPHHSTLVITSHWSVTFLPTDPKRLSHPTQHQDIWSLHPTGENTFHSIYKERYLY